MSHHQEAPAETPVTVSLSALQEGTVPFSLLEDAFGPESLGIIVVKDLPARFADLRRRLLSYSSYLANLPAEKLAELENAPAKWLVGWSCGREMLKDGVYDTQKGSFYVNCAFYKDPSLQGATGDYPSFPEYTAPNVWPDEQVLPGFRATFEELVTLIIDTAVLVARACDRYAETAIDGYREGCLERIVKESTTTKARLLHYFPPSSTMASSAPTGGGDEVNGHVPPGDTSRKEQEEEEDTWCAAHLDHGCLTGLTSAMYIDELLSPPILSLPSSTSTSTTSAPAVVKPPLMPLPEAHPSSLQCSARFKEAGLYILSRTKTPVKVSIPSDHLAFQTGEALEVITKGKFKAVPHFVKGPAVLSPGSAGAGIARNTLAVFTQPNLDDLLIDEEGENNKKSFAAFAKEVVDRNHPRLTS